VHKKRSLIDFDAPGIFEDTLPIDQISPPLYNPRSYFDPQKLEELASSFKEHGMIGRLIIRPVVGQDLPYELVVGERRFRAAKIANLSEVKVDIRELTDTQAIALALEENLNRENLNPIEETEGILKLVTLTLGLEKAQITSLLYKMIKGRDVPTLYKDSICEVFDNIKNLTWQTFARDRLRLLNLPENILEAIKQGQIEYTKGLEIAKLDSPEKQDSVLNKAIVENLTIKQIRDLVSSYKGKRSIDYSQLSTEELITDIRETYQKFTRNKKLWSSQKNRKKIETLLKQLKALTE